MIGKRVRAAAPAVALLSLAASACTAFDTPENFNRHRLSDITLPRSAEAGAAGAGSEIFYFDVSITAEFPDNNATAEAERMQWLSAWLAQRSMCAGGYEIVRKRGFGYLEDNPARRDLRYEVRCK